MSTQKHSLLCKIELVFYLPPKSASKPNSTTKNSIAIHARTPGRCALSRWVLRGWRAVDPAWTGSGHFFSPFIGAFFHSPFHSSLPPADPGGYSQVWRHARRRDRRVHVWAHACPRCVPATKSVESFSRVAQGIERSNLDTLIRDLRGA